MAFSKVIPLLKIQYQYQNFIDEFILAVVNLAGNSLHSIYMCGSIPKGTAVPGRSDADFTLVFHEKPTDLLLNNLSLIKESLLSDFPEIPKIDTPLCLVSDVLNKQNEWGFWIKIISICVHGDDLGKQLPEFIPSQNLVSELNSDTESVVWDLIENFRKSPTEKTRNKLIKRVLRAVYTLTLDRVDNWEDDFVKIYETCTNYYPEIGESLYILVDALSGRGVTDSCLIQHVKILFRFTLVKAKLSIVNIQNCRECIPLVSHWVFKEFIEAIHADIDEKKVQKIISDRFMSKLPMTFIARAGSECIGTVSMFKHDLNERKALTPWLGALYVDGVWRGLGVGKKLINFIRKISSGLGYDILYLRTEKAEEYYTPLGWKISEKLIDEYGQKVTVLQILSGEEHV